MQVDLDKPLITSVRVGKLVQRVTYEGVSTLCFSCGRLGHKRDSCLYYIKPVVREEVVVNENISTKQKETNQLDSNYGPWMVVTRKNNFNRPGRPRGPNNSNQGNLLKLKGKFVFLEPNITSSKGNNLRIVDSWDLADLARGNLGAMVVQNQQKTDFVATENKMDVCQEALSSEHAMCSEKSQIFVGADGIIYKTHQKSKFKNSKSLGIKSTKSLKGSKTQKCFTSSLGGNSEVIGTDELENGRFSSGSEPTTSIRLGHVVSE